MNYPSEELRVQIARVLDLKQAAITLKMSGRAAFDVVEERVMGETWRCLFGQYRRQFWPDMSFDMEQFEGHFGISAHEARMLFGGNELLSHRAMLIDAHLEELRAKLALCNDCGGVERAA